MSLWGWTDTQTNTHKNLCDWNCFCVLNVPNMMHWGRDNFVARRQVLVVMIAGGRRADVFHGRQLETSA